MKLVVDHRVPQAWGGTNVVENLQPLCDECNGGKQAWFSSLDDYADEIRQAMRHPEPQGRIGELLMAVRGEAVPMDLIEVVASEGAFQEDAVRRLRELRELGWIVKNERQRSKYGDRRVQSLYRLAHAEPWGEGTIREQLKVVRKMARGQGESLNHSPAQAQSW